MSTTVDDFITITDDGNKLTSKMPVMDSIVLVKLKDGSVMRAWYDANIMDAGDWDFVPATDGDEPDLYRDSIADQVVAWKPLS